MAMKSTGSEELIQSPADEIRALLEFCELPLDDACLDAALLPPAVQIIGVWRNYRDFLKPLFDRLDS